MLGIGIMGCGTATGVGAIALGLRPRLTGAGAITGCEMGAGAMALGLRPRLTGVGAGIGTGTTTVVFTGVGADTTAVMFTGVVCDVFTGAVGICDTLAVGTLGVLEAMSVVDLIALGLRPRLAEA